MSYEKWGLGIEHEMRVRFTNSLNDLSDDIKKKYFNKEVDKNSNTSKYNDKYIFVKSELLAYYFYLYEIIIMRNFKDYIKTPEDQKYYDSLLEKLSIFIIAKRGDKFPLDDKKYFDLYSNNEVIKTKNIVMFNTYIFFYTLFHAPLLFFSYYLDNQGLEISFDLFFNYNKLLEEEKNKEVLKETLRDNLEKLYDKTFSKEMLKYLKKLFEKEKFIEKVDFNIELYKGFQYLSRPKLSLTTIMKNNETNDTNNNSRINNKNLSKKSKISKIKIGGYAKNNNNNFKNNSNIDFNKFIKILDGRIKNFANIFNIDEERKNLYDKLDLIHNYNFYKNLSILYSNCIPEIDYSNQTSALEFKTVEFSNMNFEKGLAKLIELEDTFFIVINSIPEINQHIDVFGNLIYHNIGSVDTSINISDLSELSELNYQIVKEDYAGSYHIWITCPHDKNM